MLTSFASSPRLVKDDVVQLIVNLSTARPLSLLELLPMEVCGLFPAHSATKVFVIKLQRLLRSCEPYTLFRMTRVTELRSWGKVHNLVPPVKDPEK